jgi:SulP family sulfate permease
MNKIPRADAFVILAVTFITVYTWDLAIAVISWVVISALVFAWQKSQDIHVKRYEDKKWITHYELDWPVFFGSVERFKTLFDINNDAKEIIIDFADSRVLDHSAIEAINWLTEKYENKGKILHLKHLSEDCIKLLKNAEKIVDINIMEDPKYRVADDELAD